MTDRRETDYTPGDEPLPVGTVVDYTGSQRHGRYIVTEHHDPADHPYARLPLSGSVKAAYPDGVAYDLWPEGVERTFHDREKSVLWVRRLSLKVVSRPAAPAQD